MLPRGFSANLVLLLCHLCGGLCLWGFQGNILAGMFKPVYEDPIDTAQDIVDRGLIPVVFPGQQSWVDHLARSDNPLYTKLAKIAVVPPGWGLGTGNWGDYLIYGVQGNGTHVLLGNYVDSLMKIMKSYGQYHFSEEVIEGTNPYSGWITNNIFYLSDDLAKHILIYQQVC